VLLNFQYDQNSIPGISERPFIADIDDDNESEFVIPYDAGIMGSSIYLFDNDGSPMEGWPKFQPWGDFNNFKPEIFFTIPEGEPIILSPCAWSGNVYAWKANGDDYFSPNPLNYSPGPYPLFNTTALYSAIGNITGSNENEIVIPWKILDELDEWSWMITVLKLSGDELEDFRTIGGNALAPQAGCTITDFNQDGLAEILMGEGPFYDQDDPSFIYWGLAHAFITDVEYSKGPVNDQWPIYSLSMKNNANFGEPIGGIIQHNSFWSGRYIIFDDLTIPEGITLTIQAGSILRIKDGITITVNHGGRLIIQGDPLNPVYITTKNIEPLPGIWKGIVVYDGATIDMDYCDLEYATCGITGTAGSNITINNSIISNCQEMGLFQKDVPNGTIEISGTKFKDCGTYAMQICGGPTILRGDTISGNVKYGIIYVGHDNFELTGCEVTTTNSSSYWGIRITPDNSQNRPKILLTDDHVSGFAQGGYYLENCDNQGPDVQNVWAYNSGVYGLYLVNCAITLNGGAANTRNSFCNDYYGIYCSKNTTGSFRWNNIKENRYCVFIDQSSNPDFGNTNNPGQNSLKRTDNIYNSYEMYSLSRSTISAINNYWGSSDPHLWRLYGRITTTPYLSNDPIQYLPKSNPIEPDISGLAIDNYPNPFNSSTEIRFSLILPGSVSLRVYDIAGRLVRVLANGNYDIGEQSVIWDGTNSSGGKVSSGIYFYSISTPEKTITKKMVFLK
jgi:hypothetical protein